MYAKVKKILLPVLLCLAIVSLLTVSLTMGRFTDEAESDGIYSGDLNYVVSNQVEIESVDEFFTAIENGYSNIKVADGVDNPLVISGGISDVNSDLVIDLNGHEIQRNNREPLLNVTQGVRLTIIDTSKEQTGSFYNPVGSVLQISGGTLTVSAGIFESGPRSGEQGAKASEYYDKETGNTGHGAKIGQVAQVTLSKEEENGTITKVPAEMPIILPAVQGLGGGKRSVNGNMYFDVRYSDNIPADTYLYFTLNDVTVENSTITAEGSANASYSYYLDETLTQYKGTDGQDESDILITVYVYNNVKNSAESEKFSAIEMEKGNLYVRGGTYRSYFGVGNTYCVNASGGYMAIENGNFYAYGSGVCVQCAYTNVNIEEEYLRVTSGTFYSEVGNTIGVSGGRMVVSAASFTKNALDSTSAIGQSSNGSAIFVSDGTLSVSATSTIYFSLYGSGMNGISAASGATVNVKNVEMDFYSDLNNNSSPVGISNNFGIYSSGGNITCDGTTAFNVIGSHSSGIYSNGGKININGNSFTCTVEMDVSNKELSSTAVSAVGGDIYFNVAEAKIESNGLGITVGGGNISFSHTQEETIDITTTRGTAIFAYGGAVTVDAHSTLNVTSTIVEGCSWTADTSGGTAGGTNTGVNIHNGIYLQGGTFQSSGNLNVTHTGVPNTNVSDSDSKILSYAVRVDGGASDGDASVTASSFSAKNLKITVNDHGGGLYVKNGTITLGEVNSTNDVATIYSIGYGIALRGEEGDNVNIFAALTLTSESTTGIYVTGGSLFLHKTATVTSKISSIYEFCSSNENNMATDSYDGVFVENGTLTADGNFTVNFTGISNQTSVNGDPIASMIRSYAVRVDGSAAAGSALFDAENLQINTDGYQNQEGGGVYVNQGKIVLGTAAIYSKGYGIALRGSSDSDSVTVNGSLTLISASATGIYITGGSLTLNGEANITSKIDANYKFVGDDANGTVSHDGVFVEGGSLTANTAAFNVTHEGVANDDQNASNNGNYLYREFVIKSYAVRVTQKDAKAPVVEIASGTISNTIGGGIYVSGGTVTLGAEESKTGPTVTTTGTALQGNVLNAEGNSSSNWQYKQSLTGGHAIEVEGGTLTVCGGTYTADQGNGILVRNLSGTTLNNSVIVYGGTFYGYNKGYTGGKTGPAASAGLYIMGNTVTVEIYGGEFGDSDATSANNGATFFGTQPLTGSSQKRAQVTVYSANFGGYNSDAISVFRYVDIDFGSEGKTGSIIVDKKGSGVALSVQDDQVFTGNSDRGSVINIYGTEDTVRFISNSNRSIYYGCTYDYLNFYGGYFGAGNTEYAVDFNSAPYTRSGWWPNYQYSYTVKLYGGTFVGGGNRNAFGSGNNISFDMDMLIDQNSQFKDGISNGNTVVVEPKN